MLLIDITSPSRALLATTAVAVAFAGCGGAGTVDKAEVEKEVQEQLSKSVGAEAPAADCPKDLEAEKDATTRCTMKFPEGELGITVKVTSVEDEKVSFNVQADEQVKTTGS
jgi:hypothetical protein